MFHKRKRSQGFALIMAVFLLIVVSGGVLMLMSFMNIQNATSSMSIQSVRAESVAYSGLEWMQYRIRNGSDCTGSPFSFGFQESDLVGFTVSVDCAAQSYSEDGGSVTIYELRATASRGTLGSSEYVKRVMDLKLEI